MDITNSEEVKYAVWSVCVCVCRCVCVCKEVTACEYIQALYTVHSRTLSYIIGTPVPNYYNISKGLEQINPFPSEILYKGKKSHV